MDVQDGRPNQVWRWAPAILFLGIFALVLVAFAIARLVSPAGTYPVWFPFYGLWPLFLFFAFFWVIRWFFWPWGWGPAYYRRGYGYGPLYGPRDASTAIVRERYARGEITKEQYDQMMRDLSQHP